MDSMPAFPTNKRHAMHFRQQSPSDNFITARFPNPKLGDLSPGNVSISTYCAPGNIDEALAGSKGPPVLSPCHSKSGLPARSKLPRSQSSSYWMEIRKSPSAKSEPRSKKTAAATIRTEATDTQPAFESDAFAVHMPTTREPILDPPIFRAKLPAPSKAQLDAYQTYKQKAQELREQQQHDGVRVPSKIVSYDYAYSNAGAHPSELEVSPPASPPDARPAGAFPISPPIPRHDWTHSQQTTRTFSDSDCISLPREPVGLSSVGMKHARPSYQRADASTGASASHSTTMSCSQSPRPTIKIRIKPRVKVPTSDPEPEPEPEPPQKEPWWSLHNRSIRTSPQCSTAGSRTPSPTKPNFAYTNLRGDAVFGFGSHDISGTTAGASKNTAKKNVKEKAEKEKEKEKAKEKPISRWAWLRPAGPRVKPTAVHTTSAISATTTKPTAYVDPFVLHASPVHTRPSTPIISRPPSPKKLVRTQPIPIVSTTINPEKSKFETGFAQVKGFTTLVFKLCLVIYALVGLYFLLDAIREAVHALGAPFRGIKLIGRYAWIGSVWLATMMAKGWNRWGFNIKLGLKGGWRGRWW